MPTSIAVEEILIYLIVSLLLTGFAWKKKALDGKGIALANAFGLASMYFGGIGIFSVLVFLFIATEAATRISRARTKITHGQRTTFNIIGNAGPAMLLLSIGRVDGFFGAMSASLADTFSSEIGMTAKSSPVLITTLKTVSTGTDGGITVKGMTAALAGAVLISVLSYMYSGSIGLAAIILSSGIIGTLVDSILGAIFERRGKMDNTAVNFIATLIGGIAAVAAMSLQPGL